jgi:hypothetical protein
MMLNISAKTGESTANQDQEPKTHQSKSKNRENPKKNRKSTQKEGSPEVTQDQRTKTRKAVGPS